jgi:hypothetical protein
VQDIQALLIEAVRAKPERHHLGETAAPQARTMAEIGG